MHGNITNKSSPHWAVCQILSHRGPRVREEIEKIGHGAFVPTFVKQWYVQGRKFAQELPLFPGYLFFYTDPDKWGGIEKRDETGIEGVFRVLANAGAASRVTDEEMQRLFLDHATGAHNKIEASRDGAGRYSKRRRRPRPGKRIRAEMRAEREASHGRI